MKVKALRAHNNPHGKPFKKRKGSIYEHPAPEADLKAGLIEPYDESKVSGRKRAAKGAVSDENGDSEEHNATGGNARASDGN